MLAEQGRPDPVHEARRAAGRVEGTNQAPVEFQIGKNDHGVEHQAGNIDVLAHDLVMNLTLRRHIDHHGRQYGRGAAESPSRHQGARPAVVALQCGGWSERAGCHIDPPLRERAVTGLNLAASAQASSGADRVEIDAQLTGRAQHGCAWRDGADKTGRCEDYAHRLRVGRGHPASKGCGSSDPITVDSRPPDSAKARSRTSS